MSGSLAGNFRRVVDVMVARGTSGVAMQNYLGAEATRNAQSLISAGSASPYYRRFVNGQENAPNQTIKLDGTGTIIYLFSSIAEAALYALDFARKHSPRRSGHYVESWYFIVNGEPFTATDFTGIPLGSEIILTNSANYHRKIDVGGMRMSVAPQIIEQTRQAVMRRYPGVTAERKFITIPGGYVLKRAGIRSGLTWNKKQKAFHRAEKAYVSGEADRQGGQQMTYPSLFLSELI